MEKSLYALTEQLGASLQQAGHCLVTAESCTGGGVAKLCTEIVGSSAWFDSGFVVYSNASKQHLLSVKQQTIEQYGAVSEAVVLEMAQGALKQSSAQVALAVSGIAGPGGGSAYKPVGTVCIACVVKDQAEWVQTFYFQGDRVKVREQAVYESIKSLLALLTKSVEKLDV
ncbi:MAG: nicotinamide-nucleotide amidohydrolase family protein [Thiolinea sp.]